MGKVKITTRRVEILPNTEGTFLVNFKKPEGFFGNDPMQAYIKPYTGQTNPNIKRVHVTWVNGHTAVCTPETLNVYLLAK